MKLKCLRKCQSRDNYADDLNEAVKYESTFMNKQIFGRKYFCENLLFCLLQRWYSLSLQLASLIFASKAVAYPKVLPSREVSLPYPRISDKVK